MYMHIKPIVYVEGAFGEKKLRPYNTWFWNSNPLHQSLIILFLFFTKWNRFFFCWLIKSGMSFSIIYLIISWFWLYISVVDFRCLNISIVDWLNQVFVSYDCYSWVVVVSSSSSSLLQVLFFLNLFINVD